MLKGYPPEWLDRINQKSILFEFVSVYTIADIYIEYIEQRIYRVYADLDVYDYYNPKFKGLVCLGDNILLVGGGAIWMFMTISERVSMRKHWSMYSGFHSLCILLIHTFVARQPNKDVQKLHTQMRACVIGVIWHYNLLFRFTSLLTLIALKWECVFILE